MFETISQNNGCKNLRGSTFVIKKSSYWVLVGLALILAGRLEAEEFGIVHFKNQEFLVKRDPLSRSPVIIRGKDRPIITLKGALTRSRVVQSGALVADRLNPLLPLTAKQIKFKSAEKIDGLWYVSFWQTAGGLIVFGSSLGYSVDRRGRILSTGSVIYPAIEVPTAVKVDRKAALETSTRSIKNFQTLKYKLFAENVIIYPDRKANPVRFYQVYAFNFFPPAEALHPASAEAGWGIFVDTQTGKIVDRQTLFKPLGCCVPEEGPPLDTQELYKSQIGK